ncbi:sugar phosphate isomerase/epimerase family protein [Streptomyces marianii]|uniref:Sugar phosphate isomerase/epimerase n=1 Tax=Streptomyces marianii TaxID=1817406 RepID=A0A5R9DXA0_9ACTN|nr:sugar phosphate isomerase/epimerase family protein [Streptomyces marianii]TLQ41946.1 sugar phosphate isomerase/epimerase [Streptomyces marianii]
MTSPSGGLRFAYGTNGFADHRLADALHVLSDIGYSGVSLTLDHHHLDPFAPGLAGRVREVRRTLDRTGLDVVVETGARYLLDPWHKHQPTLLTAEPDGRARRLEMLRRAVDIAAELGAGVVHLWSGTATSGAAEAESWARLVDGCSQVLRHAEIAGIDLGFEPEPGMLVCDLAGYRRLHTELGAPPRFRLTLDIGHCQCLEPHPVTDCVARAADQDRLAHVQIEDMRRGRHEHLPFGEGEIDFPPVLAALSATGYGGLVSVELPRHSHAATNTARRSLEFLRAAAVSAAACVPSQDAPRAVATRDAPAGYSTTGPSR